MRRIPIKVTSYHTTEEFKHLCDLCEQTKLGKSTLIGYLIKGYKPPIPPPVEYKMLIREMRMIGNNINQILVIARSNGILNVSELNKHLKELDKIEDMMREAFDFKKRDKEWRLYL